VDFVSPDSIQRSLAFDQATSKLRLVVRISPCEIPRDRTRRKQESPHCVRIADLDRSLSAYVFDHRGIAQSCHSTRNGGLAETCYLGELANRLRPIEESECDVKRILCPETRKQSWCPQRHLYIYSISA